MSWRDHEDAKALLAACRQVNEAFGGGLKLEHVAIDGQTVAGFEIDTKDTMILSAGQVERLSAWGNQLTKLKRKA